MSQGSLTFWQKCLIPCIYPLMCFVGILLDSQHKARDRRNRRLDPYNYDKNGKEITIPKKKKFCARRRPRRRLTLPSEDLVAQSTAFGTQSHCALLQKLPREVRNIIWKEAVGGRVIHLWYTKRFGHMICAYQEAEGGAEEWNYQQGCRLCWRGRGSNGHEMLGLILTCRVM